MNVVVLAGYSGSGKTSLLEKLLPALKARGQRVSVVKHAHHRFEVDHPGKDTWRHRQAGAFEVVAAAPHQLVLQRQFEQTLELSVHHAIAELYAGVDWVLVEGFRECDLPKLEVWRPVSGKPVRYPDDPFVVAICTDAQPCTAAGLPSPTGLPVLNLNDGGAVADWLLAQDDRFAYDPERHAV